MARRKRRKFTEAFKADAVKLYKTGGRSIAQVATDLDLTETALRAWVKRAETDAGKGPPNLSLIHIWEADTMCQETRA